MYTLSTQIACLLIAQFGPEGGFPTEPTAPPRVQSAAPAAPQFQYGQPPATAPQQPMSAPSLTPRQAASEAANAPTVPLHSKSSLNRAVALVDQYMAWDTASTEGKSVTLLACLQRAANTGQQSATIKAYWRLCLAVGECTQAEEALVLLAGISPQNQVEQSQLIAAQRNAEAREAQARVDLLAAQEVLSEAANLPDETLPLPADNPFVGKYRTRLTTMYSGRTIPRELRKVDRALPHQLRLIEQLAEAVDANARLRQDMATLLQQGQTPISALLGTCRDLAEQKEKFLRAVVNYNLEIASYSQAVVGLNLSAESLVSTLIRREPANSTPRIFRDGNVLPASAREVTPTRRRGAGISSPPSSRNVQPAFQPESARQPNLSGQEFAPRPPTTDRSTLTPEVAPSRYEPGPPPVSSPAFDPGSSFQIDDTP